ncbi:putative transmembrane protein, partial [Rhizoctonia solani 123E]
MRAAISALLFLSLSFCILANISPVMKVS